MMTTMAAMLGRSAAALGKGVGSELRPPAWETCDHRRSDPEAMRSTLFHGRRVVYLYFDRLQHWWYRIRKRGPQEFDPLGGGEWGGNGR